MTGPMSDSLQPLTRLYRFECEVAESLLVDRDVVEGGYLCARK